MKKGIEDIYDLSYTQQGIFFHALYEASEDVYHNQLSFVLEGELSVASLRNSFQEVVARHSILRTSFHWEKLSKPLQVVHSKAEAGWFTEDWSALNAGEIKARFDHYITEDRAQNFDLAQPGLTRMAVFKVGEGRFQCLWSFHHLILDGWCLPIILKEILHGHDQTVPQRSNSRKFKTYIQWLKNQPKDETLQFWKKQLTGLEIEATLSQPTDQGLSFRETEFKVDLPDYEQIVSFSKREGITINSIFLGAWSILLSRYNTQSDVVFGTTVSARPEDIPGVEEIIGVFINTIPIRADLSENRSIAEFLKALQSNHFERVKHSHLSLTDIQEQSSIPAGQDLFDTLLVFENYPVDKAQFQTNGLKLGELVSYEQTNYPLSLTIIPTESLLIKAGYNAHVFSQEKIEAILSHLREIVRGLVSGKYEQVGSVPMITEYELELLSGWNSTGVPLPAGGLTLDLFEDRVRQFGDRQALQYGKKILTYRELNEQANQLARVLQFEAGFDKDQFGALVMHRSEFLAIAILAIWKCGGAYIPIDPGYPPNRIEDILTDARPAVVIAESHDLVSASFAGQCMVYHQEQLEAAMTRQKSQNPAREIEGDTLAYLIYTSGTTGRPKGVMVEHVGMFNHLLAKVSDLKIDHDSIVVQNASQCFDISVWQMFTALLRGGKTIIYDDDLVHKPEALIRQVAEDEVTILEVVPSYLAILISSFEQFAHLPTWHALQVMIVTGEAITSDLAAKWFDHYGQIPLMNAYGPTEASDDITHHFMYSKPPSELVPIGKTLQNFNIYVLDAHNNLCPPGIKGEICVSGIGVGPGYLNDEAKTRAAFVTDPYSEEKRMYRTGDIGYYNRDGSLIFLGRKDHQVKIRGYRIELGEIENVLATLESVGQVVVKVLKRSGGDDYLCGYIVPKQSLSGEDLKQALRGLLPQYMIPEHFLFMDELPLSNNGKVDRKRLPDPVLLAIPETTLLTGLQPDEALIKVIWEEVLGHQNFDLESNFFELGGHSLKAMQVASRMHEAFEKEIPLKDIFEYPTIAQLAIHVKQSVADNTIRKFQPYSTYPKEIPLSFEQERLWFLHQTDPSSSNYNMAGYLRLDGPLDTVALFDSLQDLVNRQAVLRTVFYQKSGQVYQRVVDSIDVRDEVLEVTSDTLEAKIAEHAHVPFDLEEGPLFRSRIFRTGTQRHVLSLVMHHIVADGWSIDILLNELARGYSTRVRASSEAIAPLPAQYIDYALWQRETGVRSFFSAQSGYWKKVLKAAPTALELNTDFKRGKTQSFAGAVHAFEIGKETFDQVTEFGKVNNFTPFVVLLSCYGALLSRYTGQKELLIGTPIANRNIKALEANIGFFINTLPILIETAGESTFLQLAKTTRKRLLEASTNSQLPFDQIVEELQVPRTGNMNPLVQTMFAFQQRVGGSADFEGLSVSRHESEVRSSKFDITLIVHEQEDSFLVEFEYCTDLFQKATIEQYGRHFEKLIQSCITSAKTPVSKISFLSDTEIDRLVNQWSGAAGLDARPGLLHEVFSKTAALYPNHTAIVNGEEQMTYQTLDQRSVQLANHLKARGIEQGDVVAFCSERGAEAIVMMLAILKCEAVFLSIDSAYPVARKSVILNKSKTKLLLLQKPDTDFGKLDVPVLHWETLDWSLLNRTPLLCSAPSGKEASHLIFTSGSTGQPKGALCTHASIIRLVKDTNYVHLKSGQKVAHHSSISFDASLFEIFGALLNGGELHIFSQEEVHDVRYFSQKIRSNLIDVIWVTAGLFKELAQHYPDTFEHCSYVFTGGDKADPESFRSVYEARRPKNLINIYGPTENGVYTTNYLYCGLPEERFDVPIGKPIQNSTCYILDDQLRLVPPGVNGELYLGGPGLALGYFEEPELTAKSFVKVTINHEEHRLYKTGDMVHFDHRGNIKFVGRRDRQVKIRGFRIELQEIEQALSLQEEVVNTRVMVAGTSNQKKIVAFVVLENQADVTVNELIQRITAHLPPFMVPALIQEVEEIPLNASKKVDEHQLAKMLQKRADNQEASYATTEMEMALITLWEELLGQEINDPKTDFFEAGGHSLLIARLQARINEDLGVKLQVSQLLQDSTLAAMARQISQSRLVASAIPPTRKRGLQESEMSFAQERLWFQQQLEGENAAYNMYAALDMQGEMNLEALNFALNQVLKRHEVLRTVFPEKTHQAYQKILPFEEVMITTEHLETKSALMAWMKRSIGAPFDMQKGPLWLVKVLTAEDQQVLFINMHHVISDGWSISIFVRELMQAYASFPSPAPFMELPFQYSDYAVWLREQVSQGRFDDQLAYWTKELQAIPSVDYLARFKSKTSLATEKTTHFSLTAELSQRITKQSQEAGTTVFTTLIAMYQLLLGFVSDSTDVVVGSSVANRNWPGLDQLIGFFVNQVALRLDFSQCRDFAEVLEIAKLKTSRAQQHQDLPFERVVRAVDRDRTDGQHPLFQTKLVFQNIPKNQLAFENITLSHIDLDNESSKFECLLLLEQDEERIFGTVEYDRSLLSARAVNVLMSRYEALIALCMSDVHVSLAELKKRWEQAIRENQMTHDQQHKEAGAGRLKSIKRKLVTND